MTTPFDAILEGVTFDRSALLADRSCTGSRWCELHTRAVDGWLTELFDQAADGASGAALVAIGGYGRSELCPASDIDVMLLHDKRAKVDSIANRIWYPIWDQGLKLGHSVGTVAQALGLASDDLDTATALLSCRRVVGDPLLVDELATRARKQWEQHGRRWLEELAARVEARHASTGEVAFLLEPDLKEGRGGMRDVHSLKWAEAAHRVLFANDEAELDTAYCVLLDARVELQRATGRSLNVLTKQDQSAVAVALHDETADVLMARLADAARTIAWVSDDTWRRVRSGLQGPRGRSARGDRQLNDGVVERDGEIHAGGDAMAGDDPLLALRVAVASAEHDLPIDRRTLERLGERSSPLPTPWSDDARALFEQLLLAGRPAIAVVEALDRYDTWRTLVPEWVRVRARPQHNPYHRFTIDRHLLETVAYAAELADAVQRPELLVVAAFLHDLGKGHEGDHTAVGVELADVIARRMGYRDSDVEVLQALVRHHLLLSDTAARRDLDDDATIEFVAGLVPSIEQLQLLAALTEADAKATGPTAWGSWKAGLVHTLVDRVAARLLGQPHSSRGNRSWPDEQELIALAGDGPRIIAADQAVTVVTDDRPGVFSRVAGVLALRGLDVLEAVAHSTPEGCALSRFRVVDRLRDETPWPEIVADLERALAGRLAIEARLAERARTHAAHGRLSRAGAASTTVTFDNILSPDATVVDVEAPDAIGVLYRITRALADLDLDIRSAKVQTLGPRVVDAFYVRDRLGRKVDDLVQLREIERAIVHAVGVGVDVLP